MPLKGQLSFCVCLKIKTMCRVCRITFAQFVADLLIAIKCNRKIKRLNLFICQKTVL